INEAYGAECTGGIARLRAHGVVQTDYTRVAMFQRVWCVAPASRRWHNRSVVWPLPRTLPPSAADFIRRPAVSLSLAGLAGLAGLADLAGLAVVVGLAACAGTGSSTDVAAIAKSIDSLDTNVQRWFNAGMTDSVVADYYTSDAVVMDSNSPADKGSDAIRSDLNGMYKTAVLRIHFERSSLVAADSLASDHGHYTLE